MSAKPVRLRTEARIDPVGIDTTRPTFSWQLESTDRNVRQTACEIKVLDQGRIVWESGRIRSDEVILRYGGEPLQARKAYQWTVTVWDNHGGTETSEPAFFEMGLFRSDWQAGWIEPEQLDALPEKIDFRKVGEVNRRMKEGIRPEPSDYTKLRPSQYIRKEFSARSGIKRARAYATAHGVYRLEINGKRAGNFELAPDFTSYPRYLQYQTYDITSLLKTGKNAVGAVVADGWYISRIGNSGYSCNYGNRLAFLMQLEIEYEDGSVETIVTDESFKSSEGPLIYSDLTIGERYDARRELTGWSMPGFCDSAWKQCKAVDIPLDNLVAQSSDPVFVTDEIEAIDVFTTPNGETVVDFGQNIAGRVRFRVRGNAGDIIRLQHYETLGPDGNARWNIAGLNKDQTLFYVCKGGHEEEYEAQFTFMGFRYITVDGFSEMPRAQDFTAVALSSIEPYGEIFTCSDERLNRLQKNIIWSQKANMLSIPTDCPQREKMGWTGDIQVYIKTACINAYMKSFISRWLENLKLEQGENGEIPFICPEPGAYNPGFYTRQTHHSSAGWGDAAVIVPYTMYQYYNDKKILEDNYPMMKKWVQYIEGAARNNLSEDLKGQLDEEGLERQKYIWNTGFQWGDWATPSDENIDPVNMQPKMKREYAGVAATCFYAYSAGLLSEIAGILGYHEDERYYRELADKVRDAFAGEFVGEDGTLPRNKQGNYVLALHMKMVPEEMRPKLAARLADLIIENGYRLDTGFLSTPFLLDVLVEYGYKDLAYRILYQTECPSWLYEVEKGATTIWEKWNGIEPDGQVGTSDLNHYSFGCVGDWIFRRLAGINMLEPGYKKSLIAPDFDCGLTFAKGSSETVYGRIACSWEKRGNRVTIDVVIPPNTASTIVLPNARLRDFEGFSAVLRGRDVHVDVGSGEYHFEYTMTV